MGREKSGKPGDVVQLPLKKPSADKRLRSNVGSQLPDPFNRDLKNPPLEGSTVIPFRRGLRGRDVVVEEKYPKEVDKETCVAMLDNIGPVSKELTAFLRIPDKLYLLGNDPPSFSLQPDKSAAPVANYLLFSTLGPREMPDYALHIGSKGSSVFCTFVDKERKIMVHETVNSMYAERGSWDLFRDALKKAVATVKEYESKDIKFDFVLVKNNTASAVDL